MSQNETKVWRLRSGWDRALRCTDQWPQSVMYWTKALSYILNNDFPAFVFGWLPHHLDCSSRWVESVVDDNRLLPSWEHQQLDQNALSVFLYKPQGTWSVYININDFSQVCKALQQHTIRHVGVNQNSAGNKSALWATKHKNSPYHFGLNLHKTNDKQMLNKSSIDCVDYFQDTWSRHLLSWEKYFKYILKFSLPDFVQSHALLCPQRGL